IGKFRHRLEHGLVRGNRLVKATRLVVRPRNGLKHTRRNGIELARAQDPLNRFVKTSFHQQVESVPVMARGVVWIDLDRATMLTFGDGPVEVMTNGGEAERAVCFGRS